MTDAPGALFVGLSTVDVVYLVEHIPERDNKVAAIRQLTSAGGPATNAAAAFSWLGGRAHLVSGVGRHDLACVIRRDMADFGVRHTDLLPDGTGPPTVSSILVTEATGERAIVSLGAGTTGVGAIPPSVEWLSRTACVLFDGHEMELSIGIAELARRAEVPVILDGGSWKPGMDRLLHHVTHAVCSESFLPPGCRDWRSALAFLRTAGVPHRAITRGPSPIAFEAQQAGGDDHCGEIAPPEVPAVVDTTGAGDILHGAFCYYLTAQRQAFPMALASASRVASRSCSVLGTRSWMERDGH